MTVQDILNELKSEKIASAEAKFAQTLVSTEEATPATPAVEATEEPVKEAAEQPEVAETVETPSEPVEKEAQAMPMTEEQAMPMTEEQAMEMGRAMARAYFDELQALGIHGQTNYPGHQPATGGTHPAAETMPQPEPAMAPEKTAEEKTAAAAGILAALYHNNFGE